MSSLLQSTLEAVVDVDKFPKAAVDVNVLVLQVMGLMRSWMMVLQISHSWVSHFTSGVIICGSLTQLASFNLGAYDTASL